MNQVILRTRAIYENGVFRPLDPTPGIVEGDTYRCTIVSESEAEKDLPEFENDETE